ncbi:uncharacterized protein [Physcomitrium patens]|uniref:uncharacterized protein n=1 Tax=Physcomitrium patens TaxID=3218 RepID=UPI003CCDFAFA
MQRLQLVPNITRSPPTSSPHAEASQSHRCSSSCFSRVEDSRWGCCEVADFAAGFWNWARGAIALEQLDGRRVAKEGCVTEARGAALPSCAGRQELKIVAEKKSHAGEAAGFLVEAGKTAWDASTNLIPESVPRGVARITVGVVGVSLIIHALRAFFSTALFIMKREKVDMCEWCVQCQVLQILPKMGINIARFTIQGRESDPSPQQRKPWHNINRTQSRRRT